MLPDGEFVTARAVRGWQNTREVPVLSQAARSRGSAQPSDRGTTRPDPGRPAWGANRFRRSRVSDGRESIEGDDVVEAAERRCGIWVTGAERYRGPDGSTRNQERARGDTFAQVLGYRADLLWEQRPRRHVRPILVAEVLDVRARNLVDEHPDLDFLRLDELELVRCAGPAQVGSRP